MSEFIIIPAIRDFKNIPPTVNFANYLASNANNRVIIFCFHTDRAIYSENVEVVNISTSPYPIAFFMRLIQKARSYITFYRFFLKHIKDIDLIFLGAWDFKMLMVFCKIFGYKGKIAYQYHELEVNKLKYCKLADFCIVPDENRLWITYFQGKLQRKPLLLPNIPFIDSPGPGNAPELINQLKVKGNRLILYQGLVDFRKRCINEILEAIALGPEKIHLLIMPSFVSTKDELNRLNIEVKRLSLTDRVHIIESLPTPAHLNVVRSVDAGIGLYRPVSLNQVYAAPNRLYEFSCFGIPQVLPDFPSFRAFAAKYPYAINVANPESPLSIKEALAELFTEDNLCTGRKNASKFFRENGNYRFWADNVWREIRSEL